VTSPRKGIPIRQPHHRDTTRPLRMVVDFTFTDKTVMEKLARNATRWLERIPGISVHRVELANPEEVLVRRAKPPVAERSPLVVPASEIRARGA